MEVKFTLEACRKNAGLTLKQAASKIGISDQTLSKYEITSSNIPLNLLNKLSSLYAIPTNYIFLGNKFELFQTIKNKTTS